MEPSRIKINTTLNKSFFLNKNLKTNHSHKSLLSMLKHINHNMNDTTSTTNSTFDNQNTKNIPTPM